MSGAAGNTTINTTAGFAPAQSRLCLSATILAHPNPDYVGASTALGDGLRPFTLTLGRHFPLFALAVYADGAAHKCLSPTGDGANVDIGDDHISRQALEVGFCDGRLHLHKPRGASRVCISGRPLVDDLSFSLDALARGLVINLADTVLLVLSAGPPNTGGDNLPDFGLIGGSRVLNDLRQRVLRCASTDADVLVLGPSGSGKEHVARALHTHSRRRDGPFVAVNMATLSPELAASQLFGHKRGAFTGATTDHRGYFQQAEGGTLFLDEVGDTPSSMQPLLLRALQQREIQVLGGGISTVDVRIVAATDADIDAEGAGFRTALRHRLSGLQIDVPSLDAHAEDIGLLAQQFFTKHWSLFHNKGDAGLSLGPHRRNRQWRQRWVMLVQALLLRPWPGNVRELDNTLRQIALDSADTLHLPDWACLLREDGASTEIGVSSSPMDQLAVAEPDALSSDVSEVGPSTAPTPLELSVVSQMLERHDYHIAAAARALGVTRSALYRFIRSSPTLYLAKDLSLEFVLEQLKECRGDLSQTAAQLRVSVEGLKQRLQLAVDAAPQQKSQ